MSRSSTIAMTTRKASVLTPRPYSGSTFQCMNFVALIMHLHICTIIFVGSNDNMGWRHRGATSPPYNTILVYLTKEHELLPITMTFCS